MKKNNDFNVKDEMCKCINILKTNVSRYTGGINIKFISHLLIDYHGNKIFLYKLSRIVLDNYNSLRISLFDFSIKNNVKRSIYLSKLDLNIVEIGNDLIITLPVLTEEKKKKILKLLKNEIELSKILIRNIRRKYKNKLKIFLKNKYINEDEKKNINVKLQKDTDFYIKEIDDIFLDQKKKLFL